MQFTGWSSAGGRVDKSRNEKSGFGIEVPRMIPVQKLSQVLWESVPDRIGRVSKTAAAAFTEGRELLAWPPLAVGVPVGVFIGGFELGVLHPRAVFTYSLLVMAALAAMAGFGAAVGAYAWA